MTHNQFIEKFTDQLVDHDGSTITLDTQYRSLSTWDSLTGMAVQIMMNEDLECSISDEEFIAAQTINDLYKFVKKQ